MAYYGLQWTNFHVIIITLLTVTFDCMSFCYPLYIILNTYSRSIFPSRLAMILAITFNAPLKTILEVVAGLSNFEYIKSGSFQSAFWGCLRYSGGVNSFLVIFHAILVALITSGLTTLSTANLLGWVSLIFTCSIQAAFLLYWILAKTSKRNLAPDHVFSFFGTDTFNSKVYIYSGAVAAVLAPAIATLSILSTSDKRKNAKLRKFSFYSLALGLNAFLMVSHILLERIVGPILKAHPTVRFIRKIGECSFGIFGLVFIIFEMPALQKAAFELSVEEILSDVRIKALLLSFLENMQGNYGGKKGQAYGAVEAWSKDILELKKGKLSQKDKEACENANKMREKFLSQFLPSFLADENFAKQLALINKQSSIDATVAN